MLVPDSGEADFPVYLGVPIIAHRDVLGVIAVQRADQEFNEDEEAFSPRWRLSWRPRLSVPIARANSAR